MTSNISSSSTDNHTDLLAKTIYADFSWCTVKEFIRIILGYNQTKEFFDYIDSYNREELLNLKIQDKALEIFTNTVSSETFNFLHDILIERYKFKKGVNFTMHFICRLIVRLGNMNIDTIMIHIKDQFLKACKKCRKAALVENGEIVYTKSDLVRLKVNIIDKTFVTVYRPFADNVCDSFVLTD